jgi:Mlc titration factor MtfA (ptsG expression regulator)
MNKEKIRVAANGYGAIGHKSVMDEYGATNPAEFFAVATETFFSDLASLKKCIRISTLR